ncbi:hypothetical protein PQR62_12235 [Herbaspirillum lusitanum]|uniref:Uncharacterized protein n=1 Tax=Herbaspirillum lusitanum TaxID=213312 RepID=A0ABW9ACA9_9BURK
MREMLNELSARHPRVFDQDDVDTETLFEQDKLNWDERYFSVQRKLAKGRFTRNRLDHLIQVRRYFEQQGHKGFLSSPSKSNEGTDTAMEQSVYEPFESLRNAVRDDHLHAAQTALRLELDYQHLDSAELRKAASWAKAQLPSIFEPYREYDFARAIDQDSAQWNADYYNTQIVYLNANFSEERFLHLVAVREFFHPQLKVSIQKPVSAPVVAVPAKASGSSSRAKPKSGAASARPSESESESGISSLMRTALLIGGAIAALAIVLLTIGR